MVSLVETTPLVSATPVPEPKPDVEDLFSAHDFDIQIDLPSSSQGKLEQRTATKSFTTIYLCVVSSS